MVKLLQKIKIFFDFFGQKWYTLVDNKKWYVEFPIPAAFFLSSASFAGLLHY